MPLDWTNAAAVDGPRFYEFLRLKLEEEGRDVSSISPSFVRAMYRWKHGADPDFWTVDQALAIYFGLHPSELPDDIWLEEKPQIVAARSASAERAKYRGRSGRFVSA